jgi:hypothetical protein
LAPSKTKIESILNLWASKHKTIEEAAKELAHEVEAANYFEQPIIPTDSRSREYLAALLRELARMR